MSRRGAVAVGILLIGVLAALPAPADAQGRTRRRAESAAQRRAAQARAVRAELAGVLLQTERYREAAAEFRILIAEDSTEAAYRLGLARALAWGGQPREAEPVLRALARAQPRDTAVQRLLEEVRQSFEPRADEASAWLAERPGNRTYRLALARALVRERQFPPAFAHFDTLIVSAPDVALIREAAGARGAAGDSAGNARLLGRAVALAPADDSLRREYAAALTWAGNRPAAITEYTRLLARNPRDAELLRQRGQLHLWAGDYRSAERDLLASNEIQPAAATYTLLGDSYRWRGDFQRSRAAYAAALGLAPGESAILASIAALDRAALPGDPAGDQVIRGWSASFSHAEDNAGFLYVAAGIARGFRIDGSTTGGLLFEQRRISTRSARKPERYVLGYAASAQATRTWGRNDLGVRAGVARHALVRDIPFGAVRLAGARGARSAAVEVSTGPAYLPLVSTQSLLRFDDDGVLSATPLVGRTAQLTGASPLGSAMLYVGAELTGFNDGNRRASGYASATYPVARQFNLLYSGFALGYTDRSDRYWDPDLYTAHSVGVEYALHGRGPLSVMARGLAGVGRTSESFATPDGALIRGNDRSAPQFNLSGAATWSAPTWDLAFTSGYARGRDGEYQSLNSSLRLRLTR